MANIHKCYEQASYYENRGDLVSAMRYYKEIYECVKKQTNISSSLNCEVIAMFFYRQKEYEQAMFFAKMSILNGSNCLIELYIDCCVDENLLEESLFWIRPYILKNPFADNIHTYFSLLARYTDIYEDVYEVLEMVEESFKENSAAYAIIYVRLLQLLTELEILEGNFPQARYHLRKWMFLDSTYINNVNEMIVFAIYLDDLPMFWKRKDTLFLLKDMQEEVSLFYEFAQRLYSQRDVSDALYEKFICREFNNLLLNMKKQAYIHWVQALEREYEVANYSFSDWTEMKALLTAGIEDASSIFRQVFCHHADLEEAVYFYRNYIDTAPTSNGKLENIKVTVVGGGDKIGGSCIVITIGESHLMIDAGMVLQSEEKKLDFSALHEQNIDISSMDGLIITHAHMDHIGNVPHVFQQSPSIQMYATKETKELMRLMLKKQEKRNYDAEGLLERCLYHIQERKNFFQIQADNGNWDVTFYPSGHILGAVSVLIEKDETKVFITGDYSITDQRTVKGLRLPEGLQADLVITESTYGFQPTMASLSRKRQEMMFVNQLSNVIANGGSMLIPAFALGRAQEVIALIREYYPQLHFHVYLDGLVCEVTRLYERLLGGSVSLIGNGVQIAKYNGIGFEGFVEHFILEGNSCVIASSGMLYEGTKSMEYAKRLLGDERHALTFTGYLDEESPGFSISKKKSAILMNGDKKEVRSSLLSLRLSAHASREEIVKTALDLNPQCVMLVHGNSKERYKAPYAVEQAYPTVTCLLKQAKVPVIETENGTMYSFKEDFKNAK